MSNTNKLTEKRQTLIENFDKVATRIKEVEASVQKLLVEKESLVANANAIRGAVEVLNQLLEEDTAEANNEPVELKVVE